MGMEVGLQLYTLRHLGGVERQLEMAAQTGYRSVETIGFHGVDPAYLGRCVRAAGLRVPSAHFDLFEFQDDIGRVREALAALECKQAVMPWLPKESRPVDRAGWEALGRTLAGIAADLARDGVSLAYHNHDFDLEPVEDSTGLEIVLQHPEISWQPDTGWVIAAGADLSGLIAHYHGRIPSVHAKDVDPDKGVGDEIWRDAGDGIIDWPGTIENLREAGCRYLFVEHDESPDALRTLQKGKAVLRPLAEGMGDPAMVAP